MFNVSDCSIASNCFLDVKYQRSIQSVDSVYSIYSAPSVIDEYDDMFYSETLGAYVLNENINVLYDPALGIWPSSPTKVKAYNSKCVVCELGKRNFFVCTNKLDKRELPELLTQVRDIPKVYHSVNDIHEIAMGVDKNDEQGDNISEDHGNPEADVQPRIRFKFFKRFRKFVRKWCCCFSKEDD